MTLVRQLLDVNQGWAPDLAIAAACRIDALEAALREAHEALTYAASGWALAYDCAQNGRMDEALLHTGHHEAKARAALAKLTVVLEPKPAALLIAQQPAGCPGRLP
jgi:hypothetical protein